MTNGKARSALHGLAGAVVLGMVALGCNRVPVDGVVDDLAVTVEGGLSNTAPVKLDILWVVDNSSSMCEEQNSLAANVQRFLDKFAQFNADLHMAVVTTNAITESDQGRFHHELPPPFPPNCVVREFVPCLKDDECKQALGDNWVCDAPPAAKFLKNANGSLNSVCRFTCGSDQACQQAFGDEGYYCLSPDKFGTDTKTNGCILPPLTQSCPTDLPPFVSTKDGNIDLFPCLAIVGARQDDPYAQLEQGLKVAVWALDRNPPPGAPDRSQQAREFLRDDAFQLVVFVSDEDDCSLVEGETLEKNLWNSCGCLPDETQGGPMLSPAKLAARLRTINVDPSRVLVAAIVGDVVVRDAPAAEGSLVCPQPGLEDPQQCIEAKRQAFFDSKCQLGKLFAPNTYVCESATGKADYGSRYIEFVKLFGPNGVVANICNDEGFGPALDHIADALLPRVVHVCLPRAPATGPEDLIVEKTLATGEVVTLQYGEGKDFVVSPSADCPAEAGHQAIFLTKLLEQGESLRIRYRASLVDPPSSSTP